MRPPSTSSARPSTRAETTSPITIGHALGHALGTPLVLVLALALLASTGCERSREPELGAHDVFLRYCASCHGEQGRGDGPLAASLTRPPTDLTRLALNNGGDFDESAVMAVIDGRRSVEAHGPRDMPVWGAVFQEEGSEERYPAYQSLLKSRLLVDYLRSIQQEAPRVR